jgi:peptidoglycan/LPS O-acetylase OafA/YrhL
MVAFCLIVIAAMVIADNQSRIFALWKYFFFGIIASELSPSLSRRMALGCATLGFGLLFIDFMGPTFDWAAKIGIGLKHADEQTIGLALGFSLLVAALPHLDALGRALSVLPLQILGVISYSVYVTQFFYIYANVPELGLFTRAGTPPMYQHFSQMPSYAGWYLPLVFFPGALFWGAVSFLVVERPGIKFGRFLLKGANRGDYALGPTDIKL